MFCRQKMVAERGVKNKRKASGDVKDKIKGNLIENRLLYACVSLIPVIYKYC